MKKSEMILEISQVIRTTESIHINELSRQILERLEEIGMLPPEWMHVKDKREWEQE